MNDSSHAPHEGTATAYAKARDGGISDSEAQMLAKRLAKAKGRIEELESLLRRAEDVMRAWGFDSEHKTLMDDVRTALIEARQRAGDGQP